MKKSIFDMVVALVNGREVADMETLRNEINAEAAYYEEKRSANRNLYDAAANVVNAYFDKDSSPVTCAALYNAVKDSLPQDFSKSKLAYLLRTSDEYVADRSESPSKYSRK